MASGINSTLGERGGVFGIAIPAAVFPRHGIHGSPRLFIDGFSAAVWVAAGLSAHGTIAAALPPGRVSASGAPAVGESTFAFAAVAATAIRPDEMTAAGVQMSTLDRRRPSSGSGY